ncbi:MAG: UDP-N-acetylmuramate dehydrogenase [Chitinophagaceae bacterium]|nr:UDP-N-acetylmuramate dehydrogenase [Chitinophagaceae bacterium]
MNISEHISLKPFNTFGVEVFAEQFAVFTNENELKELTEYGHNRKMFFLGGGSNVLFTKDLEGLVLKNEIRGIEITEETSEHIFIKAGAGEEWHHLVMLCVQQGWQGIENLALIPGSVGAAPIQNIGAYGIELSDCFDGLQAYLIPEKKIITMNNEDCRFGYRNSIFKTSLKGKAVILNVTLRLNKTPRYHIRYHALKMALENKGVTDLSPAIIAETVMEIRRSKLPDPKIIGNAGSFFKNPVVEIKHFECIAKDYPSAPSYPDKDGWVKIPAGWLIEQCGWKGYRKGDAGCYDKQALVLVNYGNATGKEILELAIEIQNNVFSVFGIKLEPEINIL